MGTDGHDPVAHPAHYTYLPSSIEPIDIAEHLPFCLGSALKYIVRCGHKAGADPIEDLEKAKWLIDREIQRLRRSADQGQP